MGNFADVWIFILFKLIRFTFLIVYASTMILQLLTYLHNFIAKATILFAENRFDSFDSFGYNHSK